MNDAMRNWVARIAADIESRSGWLAFEAADGSDRLVAGALACRDDAVEFEDDSGLTSELAYEAILAVRTGRQGEAGYGRRRQAPRFADDLAA